MLTLNKDLLYYISNFLDDESVSNLSQTCQKLKKYYNDDFYKYRFYSFYKIYIDAEIEINPLRENWTFYYLKIVDCLSTNDFLQTYKCIILQDRLDILNLLINKNCMPTHAWERTMFYQALYLSLFDRIQNKSFLYLKNKRNSILSF